MMFFAFFLILLGIGFILFGNYFHKDEKEKEKKGNIPRYLVKKLFNRAARKKEEYSGEIKKRIFNKKYPERELDAELESILVQERSVDSKPYQEHPEIKPNLEREPDLKELEIPVQNHPPQIKIEEIPNRTKSLDKSNLVLSGILYLDYGKEIPMDSKIINDNLEWIADPPNTIIVQLGDIVDSLNRNTTENWEVLKDYEMIYFTEHLDDIAKVKGGRCISLIGNHELMNVIGDFSFVSEFNKDLLR
jgi:hypothetical protein